MKTYQRILSVLTLLALISSSALVVLAQDQAQYDQPQYDQPSQSDPQADPPSRAARLQFTEGSVSVQPHGTDDWVTGAINRPLTNSDNVWADKNSRAEINVGTGLIRIDSESSLTLTNIGENMVQLQLHQGGMNLHVRRLYDGETYEVDTPNQAFTVLKPGDYRFDVNPDADKTVITVWRGEGESSGQGPAVRIRQNEQARFSDGNSLTNEIHAAPSPDGFDEWAQSRDGRLDHSASSRYVSPDVVGSEDLDEYGTWRDVPEYGNVWVPSRVDAGWAPYRNGHWIWVAPWGWTWVEDEPWGYAPFHYGRWVYYDDFWGWAPGPIYARPYYSPALVAWFGGPGWGANVGFGFGGGFGWCPLGFGEPFIPWYGASLGYFNQVNITNTHITNITNITNIYNNTFINNHPRRPGDPDRTGDHGRNGLRGGDPIHYANLHARNGFTAVSRDTLVNSRSVARNNVRVSANDLSRVSATRSLDVKPTRTTMLGANAGRSTAMPPPRSFARPVVSRGDSSPASRNNAAPLHGGSVTMNRGGEQSAMGNSHGVQRPAESPSNRSAGPNSNMRMPDRGSPASRAVPRPPNAGGPNAGGMTSQGRTNPGRMNQGMDRGNARPAPAYNQAGNNPRSEVYRQQGSSTWPQNNSRPASVPRPSPSYTPRNEGSASRGNVSAPTSNNASRSNERSVAPRSELSVPRPTGNISPRGYSSAADRGSYSTPSNSRSSYGGGRQSPSYNGSYGRPAQSYGGGSYSRPAPSPSPSYDRASYGRSAPAYGGGSYGRSAPAPSVDRGSYGRSAQSYSGGSSGGGGRSSGGAYSQGRASGGGSYGGGGHASAPSHNSSGGGGSRSNGDSHGRH